MSRYIGISWGTGGTAYRAVGLYTVNGVEKLIYAGLYDTPGAARQRVTWYVDHPGYRADHILGEDVRFVDAWVEPVAVINHPGVRYTDDWALPTDDRDERLRAVAAIADAMNPPGDQWTLTHAITRLATNEFTVDQAREWLGEGWEDL